MTGAWRDHFSFLPQGGIIQKFKIGDHNIVLGFDDAKQYEAAYSAFFGETIGRCANRISDAKIDSLNGQSYQLAANNGPNTLHGGERGWGKKTFDGPKDVTRHGQDAVEFIYKSVDGEEGFPGDVQLKVWYTGEAEEVNGKQEVSLQLEYEAVLVGDAVDETVINVTNHSYFNITGKPTIEGTSVTLSTNLHQVTDKHDTPTGAIEAFPNLTVNESFVLGKTEPAVDHCFIVNNDPATVPLDTRGQPLRKLCEMHHADTNITFEAYSTEPAFQYYTGQYIDVPSVNGKPGMGARSGICVEASRYVNAINDPRWRSMVVLKRGQIYGSKTVYKARLG